MIEPDYATIVRRKAASHPCWKCSLLPHCPAQNRCALSLEMLTSPALSDAKPLRTFAGNAHFSRIVLRKTAAHFCWKCSLPPHCPAQNRCALLLEMLTSPAFSCAKPLRTFAGNAHFSRIVLRKTAARFCWKCSLLPHCPTQNRFALLLEMLTFPALSCAKPLRTFAGNALDSLALRAPAAVGIDLADHLHIRNRANRCTDLHLRMGFDRRLGRTAVFLAPDEGYLRAGFGIFRIDHCQGKHLALVGAIADPGGYTDGVAAGGDLVERVHGIDRGRELHELAATITLFELRADNTKNVFVIQREGYLAAMIVLRLLFQRFAADEVVVEFHKGTVAEIPGREVVVLDIIGNEAAADRCICLIALVGEPFAIGLHLLACIHGGQR